MLTCCCAADHWATCRRAAAGVGGSYPSALNDLANGKSTVMPTRSAAKLENLAALEMPFELKALEVCLDSVRTVPATSAAVLDTHMHTYLHEQGSNRPPAPPPTTAADTAVCAGSVACACQRLRTVAWCGPDSRADCCGVPCCGRCPCCPSHTQIASYLNRLTSDLEAAAYPALDALTSRVTSHNLERVRRIKSRLVRLTTRVENVSHARLWGVRRHVQTDTCVAIRRPAVFCVCVCTRVCWHRRRPWPLPV